MKKNAFFELQENIKIYNNNIFDILSLINYQIINVINDTYYDNLILTYENYNKYFSNLKYEKIVILHKLQNTYLEETTKNNDTVNIKLNFINEQYYILNEDFFVIIKKCCDFNFERYYKLINNCLIYNKSLYLNGIYIIDQNNYYNLFKKYFT